MIVDGFHRRGWHKWIRTTDLALIRRALYPTELCASKLDLVYLLSPCTGSHCLTFLLEQVSPELEIGLVTLFKIKTSRDARLRQLAGGGDDGIRTHDPLLAGQVLSQLSYTPVFE